MRCVERRCTARRRRSHRSRRLADRPPGLRSRGCTRLRYRGAHRSRTDRCTRWCSTHHRRSMAPAARTRPPTCTPARDLSQPDTCSGAPGRPTRSSTRPRNRWSSCSSSGTPCPSRRRRRSSGWGPGCRLWWRRHSWSETPEHHRSSSPPGIRSCPGRRRRRGTMSCCRCMSR